MPCQLFGADADNLASIRSLGSLLPWRSSDQPALTRRRVAMRDANVDRGCLISRRTNSVRELTFGLTLDPINSFAERLPSTGFQTDGSNLPTYSLLVDIYCRHGWLQQARRFH